MDQQSRNILPLSWDQFHRDTRALARQLSGQGPFTTILAITRGGLTPAAIIARELNLRVIETICIASYAQTVKNAPENEQRVPQVLKGLTLAVAQTLGSGILVVDDLVDSGATMKILREILPNAHFATVYAKPAGRAQVDSFILEVSQDTWINFPWDLGLTFQPPIGGA